MEITEGKIRVTRAELQDRELLRQIDAIAAQALRDCCIMHSPDDMRSATTLAEDFGLLVITDSREAEQKTANIAESLVL